MSIYEEVFGLENPAARKIRESKERLFAAGAEREAKAMQPRKAGPKRFTTDYAVKYGRRQGWKLIERERYDFNTKRHHDLEAGVDVMFDDGDTGRVGIQGAGRYERKEHRARFEAWGGEAKAKRRNLRVLYLEFERGNPEPVVLERWA